MERDLELKQAVLAELAFESAAKTENIAVSVKDGIIMLTGVVSDYAKKLAVTHAAKRLAGVRGIVEDIIVSLPSSSCRTDSEIAAAAAAAIKSLATLPSEAIAISVRDGYLTLTGTVERWRQKTDAEEIVGNLTGVKGIINRIAINPRAASEDIKGPIKAALGRHALLRARHIEVETHEGKVVLRGMAHSFIEREEAERAAWTAQGVTQVENRIVLIV